MSHFNFSTMRLFKIIVTTVMLRDMRSNQRLALLHVLQFVSYHCDTYSIDYLFLACQYIIVFYSHTTSADVMSNKPTHISGYIKRRNSLLYKKDKRNRRLLSLIIIVHRIHGVLKRGLNLNLKVHRFTVRQKEGYHQDTHKR